MKDTDHDDQHRYDEERLAQLLKILPPAPEGWVKAAQELPQARREIDEIAERAQRDAEFRAAVEADLESALTQAGYDVDPSLLPELRDRLHLLARPIRRGPVEAAARAAHMRAPHGSPTLAFRGGLWTMRQAESA